jgi:XTP/dITP diphosphohydrolase
MTVELVAATANPDKLVEISATLYGVATLMPRPEHVPEVVEDAPTLHGNARLKAEAIRDATGRPAVADDTGLEVDALGGAPGVHAARYAGADVTYADNVAKLLLELEGVAEADRTARFRTVAIISWPDGSETVAEGVIEGTITIEAKGDGGFGYDPVFRPAGSDGRTFAEMSLSEKQAVSHRGRAFRALAESLVSDTGTNVRTGV